MDNKSLIKEFYEEVVSKNLVDKIENYVDINCVARVGENYVISGIITEGTHLGEWLGIKPTGKKLEN